MQAGIPYMQIRGGSSKGVYFCADDLPTDTKKRDQVLLSALGRDDRQIDGLGGANPLTSKVGIVSLSSREDSDINYLFVQVVVGENRVDTTPNCGNILAGVGAFALESGMIPALEDTTTVRVYMENSGNRCDLEIQTPSGQVEYQGDARIDGVPGTSAPIICNYKDIAGSACGSLLPTGNALDIINDVPVTCIDNGMPVVVINAKDLGKTGYETCEELSSDPQFKEQLEAIRLKAGEIMNLGDVTNKVVPKMTLISPSKSGAHVNTRTFIPHVCHAAIGVLGAVSVASACILKDSVAEGTAVIPEGGVKNISVQHPSGEFSVELQLDNEGNVVKAGLLRTARLLSRGELYI